MKTNACFKSSFAKVFFLAFFFSFFYVGYAQDASLPFPQTSFTTRTINSGLLNEVVFSHNGASFSSSSQSNCPCMGGLGSGTTLRVDNNGDSFDINTPSGTINRVSVCIGSNSGTVANAIIAFSTDGSTWGNFQELSLPANTGNPSCNTHLVNAPAGAKYFRMQRNTFGGYTPSGATGQTIRVFTVDVWVNASTAPTLTVTPTSITGLTKNIASGGTASTGQFTVSGSNLTANATVTAPTGFEVSLNGITWGTAQIIPQTGGIITDVPVYVRISSTTVGSIGPLNVTIASTDATTQNVSVSGTVVNLTPLATPTGLIGTDLTHAGFTASWTAVTGAVGYTVKVYQGTTLVNTINDVVGTTTEIIGLNELTTYTFTVTAIGNGTTNGDSAESPKSAGVTTTKAPISNKITCWTEDFETLAPSANTNSNACPATGETTNELRYNADSGNPSGTNRCETGPFNLALPSGIWTSGNALGASGAGHGGSSRSLFMRNTNATITLPTLDNPRSVSFYVYAKGAVTNPARGLKIFKDGSIITANIKIDDIDYVTADGLIRFSSAGWHKVWVEVDSNTQTTVRLEVTGDSSMDIWLDDFTIECSSMLLTASPNASGMNYVVDMGPSNTRTFTIVGTDLPLESGNITLSNLGNFQVSFDNGITWSTGVTVTLPYNSSSFAQSVLVRLKAGLSVGDYNTTIAFTCPGYTKVLPTITCSGKVTLLPNTLPCGEEVVLLHMKGTNESNILLDAITGTNWTAVAETKNNHFLLKRGQSLVSPLLSLGDFDLKDVSFYFQPTNATSMTMTLSLYGTGGSFSPVTFNASQKIPYFFTHDLSSAGFTDNVTLTFTDGGQTDIEMWEIVVTGMPKRQITLSTALLTGFSSSSIDCPSESQSFLVLGTCLDSNSSLKFESNTTPSQYEFSTDENTWGTTINYTGKFPVNGMKVYVRQKGTASATAFTTSEIITITNNGTGAATLLLSGTVTPPSDLQVPTEVNFSSLTGIASIRNIPLIGGEFCQPLVVTHNCGAGLTIANCEGGTYAANTSFVPEDIDRTLYLRYTPGANLNCKLTLTSGSFTKQIDLVWTGSTNITNGVATDNTSVQYSIAAGFGKTNVWKAGALPDATIVTITSADFEVSMGNPEYGDFEPITSAKLGDLNGILFIRQKASATTGTITLVTAGGQTTIINVTVL